MRTYNFPNRVQKRRDEAKERQAVRDSRSSQQQLDVLDDTLGKDQGARKERSRLKKLLTEPGSSKKK